MNDNLYVKGIEAKEYPNDDIYPFNIPVIKNLKKVDFQSPVTFIVGENGSGKSTLIEAIAVILGFNPEGGSKNFYFSTQNTHSQLHKYLKVIKGIEKPLDGYFFRAEALYNLYSDIDELDKSPGGGKIINYYGGKSLHKMSHGESFLTLVNNRFGGHGIYILDEPEAALSPTRQLSLLLLIKELVNKKSQFIIATHSPIILGYPNSDILQIRDGKIDKVKYEDTENYFLTKSFLNNPKSILEELFKN